MQRRSSLATTCSPELKKRGLGGEWYHLFPESGVAPIPPVPPPALWNTMRQMSDVLEFPPMKPPGPFSVDLVDLYCIYMARKLFMYSDILL